MTAPRPICPIPPDAKVGDVVVCRNGSRSKITEPKNKDGEYRLFFRPPLIHESGKYLSLLGDDKPQWDCIAFEYADGRKPTKSKRTQAQRDAKFIRSRAVSWWHRAMTNAEYDRMRAIADRLEKQP